MVFDDKGILRMQSMEAHTFFEDLFEASELKRKKKINNLLDIILTRYPARRGSVITSNRPLEHRGKLLRDNTASSTIVDRLLHRAHLLQFEGKGHRLKEASIKLTANNRKRSI